MCELNMKTEQIMQNPIIRKQMIRKQIIRKQIIRKQIIKNIVLTVLCIIFSTIYEFFSHQVYSIFMIGAFIVPLLAGVGINVIRWLVYKDIEISESALAICQCGVYTLTVGSIFKGILDIYGTTNSKGILFWYVGFLLIAIGGALEFIHYVKERSTTDISG